MTEKVSVIMTCYNEGRHIGAAVRSILDQTQAERIADIVIADDGSAAETIAILQDVVTWDPRIRVLFGSGGAGPAAQRNRAIAESTAPLIAILDGDDLWTPDKLEKQLPVLERDPAIGLVYTDFFAFTEDNLAGARRAGIIEIGRSADLMREYFLNDPPILPSTVILRRTAFEAVSGFDPHIRVFEETDFYLRLSRVCRFGFVGVPLLYKRNRAASITGGRTDLMAHHAFVALKAAALEPRLFGLVPTRLAERARKLGSQRYLVGDLGLARQLLGLALRLAPLSPRTWAVFLLVRLPAPLSDTLRRRLFARKLRALSAATDAGA